jgi:hypothetical protein
MGGLKVLPSVGRPKLVSPYAGLSKAAVNPMNFIAAIC